MTDDWPPLTLAPGWEDLLKRGTGLVPAARRIGVARVNVPLAAELLFVNDAVTSISRHPDFVDLRAA